MVIPSSEEKNIKDQNQDLFITTNFSYILKLNVFYTKNNIQNWKYLK